MEMNCKRHAKLKLNKYFDISSLKIRIYINISITIQCLHYCHKNPNSIAIMTKWHRYGAIYFTHLHNKVHLCHCDKKLLSFAPKARS